MDLKETYEQKCKCKFCGKDISLEKTTGGSFVGRNGLGYGEAYYEEWHWYSKSAWLKTDVCFTWRYGFKVHQPL